MIATKSSRDYAFVGLQLLLCGLYLWPVFSLEVTLPYAVSVAGLGLVAVGIIIGLVAAFQLKRSLSPFPTPLPEGKLETRGMFAYARHPIYTGLLLAAFGYGLFTGSGYRLLVAAGLGVLFYYKSAYEERRLAAHYPAYPAYRKRVGRFTPWW